MDVSGTSSKGEMNLEIEFLRTDNEERILASGMLTLSESSSHEWQVNKLEYQSNIYVFLLKYFQIRINGHNVRFIVPFDFVDMPLYGLREVENEWLQVKLGLKDRNLTLSSKTSHITSILDTEITFDETVRLGAGKMPSELPGFVGCVRNLKLDRIPIDFRTISTFSDNVYVAGCKVINNNYCKLSKNSNNI